MSAKNLAVVTEILPCDESASNDSAVKRDSNGDVFVKVLNCTKIVNTGGVVEAVLAKTAHYTVTIADRFITVDATGGAATLTFPAVATCAGSAWFITRINSGANAVTLDGASAETINGAATLVLSAQWQCALVLATSTELIAFLGDSPNINATLTLAEAANLVLGTTTGTKIGTAVSQKLGFWNATPIIQPASANQAVLSLDVDVTGTDQVDKAAINTNFTAIQTLVNQLRADLVAAGLIKGSA